ncbi:MAG: peptidyl-tRNA hydrolase, partial [Streptosporangiaceae bacterium]
LYLITRADLAPGTQVCHAAHAALDFAIAHPAVTARWHAASNTLVVLAAPDELSLGWLCDDAAAAGLLVVRFHEPDLGGALTAAALEPAAARLVSRLPLAFSHGEEVRT